MLSNLGAAHPSSKETEVREALRPLEPQEFVGSNGATDWTSTLLRTASVVVLPLSEIPPQEITAAFVTKRDGLPPLPYARLWFEFSVESGPTPYELGSVRLIGLAATGDETRWAVTYIFQLAGEGDYLHCSTHMLGADGRFIDHDAGAATILSSLTILLVELLSAYGVHLDEMPVARPRRREFERRFRAKHPTVYRVALTAGRSESRGNGKRKYTCRWMVRGHWRTYASGVRIWVRAHVKGPSDAPWRGKPLYMNPPSHA